MTTAIRRSSVRRYRVSRVLTFGPAVALPLWGWHDTGEPLHWAGLAVMTAAALFAVPAAVLVLLFFLPAALRGGLVPRQWRIKYRIRHGRKGARSEYISKRLKTIVHSADRWRCLYCGMPGDMRTLNADHIRPWSVGGLTTLFNLGTLCQVHNLVKLNYWRERNGYIWYRPDMRTPERLALAADILRVERRKRWSPLRLLRAAWALG